jgi:acid phosphatase type 7
MKNLRSVHYKSGFIRIICLLIIPFIAGPTAFNQSNQETNISGSAIAIYGDSRTGDSIHQIVVKAMISFHPVAVFHVGDLVFNGRNENDWKKFMKITAGLREHTKFYPALGNHERETPYVSTAFDIPDHGKWYSVDVDSIHFIVLDYLSDFSENSIQYQWLKKDLTSSDEKKQFKIIVLHSPVYSTGPHIGKSKEIRAELVPLFEKYHVGIVFSGHNHCYERSIVNNIAYIVTGGGGAPLMDQVNKAPWSQIYLKTYHFCILEINRGEITLKCIDTSLRVLDEVAFKIVN